MTGLPPLLTAEEREGLMERDGMLHLTAPLLIGELLLKLRTLPLLLDEGKEYLGREGLLMLRL